MSVSVTKVLLGVFLLNTVTAAQMICLSGSKCVEVTIECVNNSFAQISWTNSNNMYVRLTACGGKDFGTDDRTSVSVPVSYTTPLKEENHTCTFEILVTDEEEEEKKLQSFSCPFIRTTGTILPSLTVSSLYQYVSTVATADDVIPSFLWKTSSSFQSTLATSGYNQQITSIMADTSLISSTHTSILSTESYTTVLTSSTLTTAVLTSSRSATVLTSSTAVLASSTLTTAVLTSSTLTTAVLTSSMLTTATVLPNSNSGQVSTVTVYISIAVVFAVLVGLIFAIAVICCAVLLHSKKSIKIHHHTLEFGIENYIHLNVLDVISITESIITVEQPLEFIKESCDSKEQHSDLKRKISLPTFVSTKKEKFIRRHSDQSHNSNQFLLNHTTNPSASSESEPVEVPSNQSDVLPNETCTTDKSVKNVLDTPPTGNGPSNNGLPLSETSSNGYIMSSNNGLPLSETASNGYIMSSNGSYSVKSTGYVYSGADCSTTSGYMSDMDWDDDDEGPQTTLRTPGVVILKGEVMLTELSS